jgi:hypothetical protein
LLIRVLAESTMKTPPPLHLESKDVPWGDVHKKDGAFLEFPKWISRFEFKKLDLERKVWGLYLGFNIYFKRNWWRKHWSYNYISQDLFLFVFIYLLLKGVGFSREKPSETMPQFLAFSLGLKRWHVQSLCIQFIFRT